MFKSFEQIDRMTRIVDLEAMQNALGIGNQLADSMQMTNKIFESYDIANRLANVYHNPMLDIYRNSGIESILSVQSKLSHVIKNMDCGLSRFTENILLDGLLGLELSNINSLTATLSQTMGLADILETQTKIPKIDFGLDVILPNTRQLIGDGAVNEAIRIGQKINSLYNSSAFIGIQKFAENISGVASVAESMSSILGLYDQYPKLQEALSGFSWEALNEENILGMWDEVQETTGISEQFKNLFLHLFNLVGQVVSVGKQKAITNYLIMMFVAIVSMHILETSDQKELIYNTVITIEAIEESIEHGAEKTIEEIEEVTSETVSAIDEFMNGVFNRYDTLIEYFDSYTNNDWKWRILKSLIDNRFDDLISSLIMIPLNIRKKKGNQKLTKKEIKEKVRDNICTIVNDLDISDQEKKALYKQKITQARIVRIEKCGIYEEQDTESEMIAEIFKEDLVFIKQVQVENNNWVYVIYAKAEFLCGWVQKKNLYDINE